ncbi:hypothetical protein [Anaerosporobacter faecicola]|uniref:hypothetical protein n=1 Tax=Anaerosporobacter faecicola TaxID=2718714 RepID=UPI0014396B05|nr:hypothetical protein [Anaerosporobacter faecicola]
MKVKTERFIHRASILIVIMLFVLSYGTLGALEQENIELMVATRRLVIFIPIIIFGSCVAYLTREER